MGGKDRRKKKGERSRKTTWGSHLNYLDAHEVAVNAALCAHKPREYSHYLTKQAQARV